MNVPLTEKAVLVIVFGRMMLISGPVPMRVVSQITVRVLMRVTTGVLISRVNRISMMVTRTRCLQRMQARVAEKGRGAMQEKQKAGREQAHERIGRGFVGETETV